MKEKTKKYAIVLAIIAVATFLLLPIYVDQVKAFIGGVTGASIVGAYEPEAWDIQYDVTLQTPECKNSSSEFELITEALPVSSDGSVHLTKPPVHSFCGIVGGEYENGVLKTGAFYEDTEKISICNVEKSYTPVSDLQVRALSLKYCISCSTYFCSETEVVRTMTRDTDTDYVLKEYLNDENNTATGVEYLCKGYVFGEKDAIKECAFDMPVTLELGYVYKLGDIREPKVVDASCRDDLSVCYCPSGYRKHPDYMINRTESSKCIENMPSSYAQPFYLIKTVATKQTAVASYTTTRETIPSSLHLRDLSCPQSEQYHMVADTFCNTCTKGTTITTSALSYSPNFFCDSFPALVINENTSSATPDIEVYNTLISGGSKSVPSGQRITLFYVTTDPVSKELGDALVQIDVLSAELQAKIDEIASLAASIEEKAGMIAALNATLEEQAAIIAYMTQETNEQAYLIQQLSDTVDEQAILIQELTQKREEQAALINSMQLNIEEQAALIAELTSLSEEQATIIDGLELNLAEKAALIQALSLEIENQAALINEMSINLQEKAALINLLTAENEEQAALIDAMRLSFSDQATIIDALNLEITDDARIISELTASTEAQGYIISQLNLQLDEDAVLIQELTSNNAEQAAIIESLNLKATEMGLLIESMQLNISEQAEIINNLKLTNDDIAKLLAELQLSNDEYKVLVEQLNLTIEEQQKLLQDIAEWQEFKTTLLYGLYVAWNNFMDAVYKLLGIA